MRQTAPQNPTRAVSIAIASGAIVATGMMFVPVGMLEGLIGPTGLSELVPAAGAPLGDVARALIAYATGAATLGGLTVFLLRDDGVEHDVPQPRETAVESLRHYRAEILQYLSTKMPWHKEADDIRSLSDLSRFRSLNMSAEAPTRRPLIASQDLPDLGLTGQPPVEVVAPDLALKAEHFAAHTTEPAAPVIKPAQEAAPDISTADMLAQLETAMAIRHQKRALLGADTFGDFAPIPDHGTDGPVAPVENRRPVLELVSSAVVKDEDADSALAAALATLNRMTATSR